MNVDAYLDRLRAALYGMPEDQVEEIVRELRGHIDERAEEAGSGGLASPGFAGVLESLGDPEELARMYRADAVMERAECRNSSFLILHSLCLLSRRSVAGFFVAAAAGLGYVWAIALGAAAVDKLIEPGQIGVWYTSGRLQPFELVVNGRGPSDGREILGWWLVPVGAGLCMGLFALTKRFGRWWIRRSLHTRQGGPWHGKESAV